MAKNTLRWMAGSLLVFMFGLTAAPRADAQSHLAVELGHPVYGVIETAELRGVLTRLSSVKPYTRAQVAEFLATIQANMDVFSPVERAEIRGIAAEFEEGARGDIGQAFWKAPNAKAALGGHIEATGRFDVAGIADLASGGTGGASSGDVTDLWHLNSLIQPYVKLYPEPWLSLWGTIGITYDKVNRDLYLPYTFTKEWDSYHNKVSTSPTTDGEEAYPTWSFDLRNDVSGATDSGSLRFRLSRFRRDWGMSSGSLSLSGTARPFMGLEVQFRPSEIFAITNLIGSLGNWEKGKADRSAATDDYGNSTAVTEQKMFAIQRLELFPFPWLTLGANGTMIGAKRFELGYISPMMFALEYQVTMSDIDNMGVQGDIQILLKRLGKLYASLYIDEIELSGFEEWFTRPRNMFALQGGAKLNLPFLPFGTLSAQYTKIEPFVYTHYPTWNYESRLRVNESYTNDGENLGYYLPPNSDEFLLRLESRIAPDWRATLQYSFVRHGDNSDADYADGKYLIYGDVDKYQDYSKLSEYPDKNFLHDGIYDYNHIAKLKVCWRPAEAPMILGAAVPLELGAGYGLSYTWWEDGTGEGAAVPDAEWKNVLELSCKFFL
ncbi:MAG TPA: hypothetical protein VN445_08455 [Rectinemataceae bacterium]|nr:hypothetical protein [Rectinemataceae bacterium]